MALAWLACRLVQEPGAGQTETEDIIAVVQPRRASPYSDALTAATMASCECK